MEQEPHHAERPGPERGTEEYTELLERRIKEQRDHIVQLTTLKEPGDRQARKRIAKLERLLGKSALKIAEQKATIAWFRNELAKHGAEPTRRSA